MRIIARYVHRDHATRVYRNVEWDEYIVRVYRVSPTRLTHIPADDYHTPDRQDAIDTAQSTIGLVPARLL